MSKKTITGIFILAIVILCLGYDAFTMIFEKGADATISEWFWTNSKAYPIIPLAFGILVGHLFSIPSNDLND